MRILHLPLEISGQAGMTCRALRELGVEAHSLARRHPFEFENDFYLSRHRKLRRVQVALAWRRWIREYDVFHYHYATPLMESFRDVEVALAAGKRVVVEFWGSDVRIPSLEGRRNPFWPAFPAADDEKPKQRLRRWAELTHGEAIVADHSLDYHLEPLFDSVHIVGQRIEVDEIAPSYPNPDERLPLVMHAPRIKSLKGTEFVLEAIRELEARGLSFRYEELFRVPHRVAMDAYARADIVIDQLLVGSFGILACEAMALGKPVICYIQPDLVGTYTDLPIVNASPSDLAEVLEGLILDGARRERLGRAGRAYVERHHDSRKVARRLLEVYASPGSTRTPTKPPIEPVSAARTA